jgi:hypothetical protein
LTTGLSIGTAGVSEDNAAATYAKPKDFLHQVRQVQLDHVADRSRISVAETGSADGRLIFGVEGGVLNKIWLSHFTGFAGHADHVDGNRAAAWFPGGCPAKPLRTSGRISTVRGQHRPCPQRGATPVASQRTSETPVSFPALAP